MANDTEHYRLSEKPELLCPAGSPLALEAAIEGGADAVYLGGPGFNARMNASNFDLDALRAGISLAHRYGVKVYLTLNTLIYDREIPAYLQAAWQAADAGADALIVADAGGAAVLRRTLPELPLHASTQMSAHSGAAGKRLAELGFSRMVVARELTLSDLTAAVRESPIEIEAFIHGALCVCHSGQCLFSSLVGGRSGNRGECAQPCRLPYRDAGGRECYPLSLKDLSLARHVPELLSTGVRSLKIEGRMRSPAYVQTVARVWRRLLDEGRSATAGEMEELADAFSRNGFTDGYFTGRQDRHDKAMLGTRTDENKRTGREMAPFTGLARTLPLQMDATLTAGKPALLTLTAENGTAVTVTGAVPEAARSAPLTEETVARQLGKLGGTGFSLAVCNLHLDPVTPVMLPVSALNALRRAGTEALKEALAPVRAPLPEPVYQAKLPLTRRSGLPERSARFADPAQLTPAAAAWFDVCYLPAEMLTKEAVTDEALAALRAETEVGVLIPPVIPDRETAMQTDLLRTLRKRGFDRCIVGNLGQLALVQSLGFRAEGGFRLNVTNSETVALYEALGVEHPILSPELTLPQIRDIRGDVRTLVYGRIPLMLLEKCVIREVSDCTVCGKDGATLTDRRGASFPVLRIPSHRNILYNSLPTNMSDVREELERMRVGGLHFLFSVESPAEVDAVIRAWKAGTPLPGQVRRIGKG